MKFILKSAVAAFALTAAMPAYADVELKDASDQQGVLVHGTGDEQTALEVVGNLGANGPTIVHFNGDTDSPTNNFVRLQDGEGQADITGAEISVGGNPEGYNLLSGNIFLEGHEGMDWIEFALTGEKSTDCPQTGCTVDFYITDDGGTVWEFLDQVLGSGDTHFGFDAISGQLITNVFFQADTPQTIDILKQVRILREGEPSVVPEPSTWAMMLMGFGFAGFAMRRRRRGNGLSQLA
jgi:hypothetical protein